MFFQINSEREFQLYIDQFKAHLSQFNCIWTRCVDLGIKKVRLIGYTEEFLPHIEKQLAHVLCEDRGEPVDATIHLWQNENFFLKGICDKNDLSTDYLRSRLLNLYSKREQQNLQLVFLPYSQTKPVIDISQEKGIFICRDVPSSHYYYGVRDLSPEEFIKEGHIFVQFFNDILKGKASNLVHGALVGFSNKGILLCARGQCGKSTLAIDALLDGFEYVSDDYLTLHQNGDNLLANPIYSIVTLSPLMYNKLYDKLAGCRFVSNNARKDKYVLNISVHHPQFRKDYPVKACLFPKIDLMATEPTIQQSTLSERNRAIVQFVHSTVSQMGDCSDSKTVLKLIRLLKPFAFYTITLTKDIHKNTLSLRNFIENATLPKQDSATVLPPFLLDVTFGQATIIDTRNGAIYSMNKKATKCFIEQLKIHSESDTNCTDTSSVMPQKQQDDLFNVLLQKLNFVSLPFDQQEEVWHLKALEQNLSMLRYLDGTCEEIIK